MLCGIWQMDQPFWRNLDFCLTIIFLMEKLIFSHIVNIKLFFYIVKRIGHSIGIYVKLNKPKFHYLVSKSLWFLLSFSFIKCLKKISFSILFEFPAIRHIIRVGGRGVTGLTTLQYYIIENNNIYTFVHLFYFKVKKKNIQPLSLILSNIHILSYFLYSFK